ncbi:DUF664 domain-containing protein [Streptomyces sp. NPDC052077]|uniref:mycothiol transferase n=1 Tax=Streptomyces sp. NPDC052077 TaxID=3154757 RepID=UPI0034381C12
MADAYRSGIARTNEIARARTDLDRPGARSLRATPPPSMRWALVHTIEETARHAGHADIPRQRFDGSTGRQPRAGHAERHRAAPGDRRAGMPVVGAGPGEGGRGPGDRARGAGPAGVASRPGPLNCRFPTGRCRGGWSPPLTRCASTPGGTARARRPTREGGLPAADETAGQPAPDAEGTRHDRHRSAGTARPAPLGRHRSAGRGPYPLGSPTLGGRTWAQDRPDPPPTYRGGPCPVRGPGPVHR